MPLTSGPRRALRPESSFLRTEKPRFLLPARSLARAHPIWAPLNEKSILYFPALSPREKSQQVPCAGAGGLHRGDGGSAEDSFSSVQFSSVRTTTPGLSPGETFILQFWDGLLGGTSRPGCQSVCASPPLLLILLPGHPGVRHGSTRSCAPLGRSGGKSAVPLLGVMMAFFFLPRSHRCLVCSPSTKRICKGIPQNTQNGHLHILLTESVLSFQLIASYDFFLYYKYYINNV